MPVDHAKLAAIPLFTGLAAAQLQMVAERARERSFRAGVAILHQDEPGETFYVIVQGTVRVTTTLPDGSEVFLALLAAGDTVGEMSLVDTAGRSADVVTQEPTTLIAIDRSVFDALMQSGSIFAKNMLQMLARRLRLANVRIQAHCTLDVYGMVAFQLLEFAELYGQRHADGTVLIPIRLTQTDIAQLVGASRERVNQVMVAYKRRDLISADQRYYITILNSRELRKRVDQGM